MDKKIFVNPEIDVTKFEVVDIITTSGDDTSGDDWSGGDF